MAWIYLAASEDSPSPWTPGCGQSPTVKPTGTLKVSYSAACPAGPYQSHLFGTTCAPSADGSCLVWTWFMADSLARTSALLDMAQAWRDSEADFFTRLSGWPRKSSPPS